METKAEQRIWYRKRFLISVLIFGGFLLTVAVHLCVTYWANFPAMVGLFFCAMIGSWAVPFAIARLIFPKPAIILDAKGLTDFSHRNGVGFIDWSEIETIFCAQNGVTVELIVLPKDPEAFLARLSWYKRMNCKASLSIHEALVTVPLLGLTLSHREIMVQIGQYWKTAVDEVLIIPPRAH